MEGCQEASGVREWGERERERGKGREQVSVCVCAAEYVDKLRV